MPHQQCLFAFANEVHATGELDIKSTLPANEKFRSGIF